MNISRCKRRLVTAKKWSNKGPANDNSSGMGEDEWNLNKVWINFNEKSRIERERHIISRARSERAAHMKNPLFRNTPKVWWDSLVAILVDGISRSLFLTSSPHSLSWEMRERLEARCCLFQSAASYTSSLVWRWNHCEIMEMRKAHAPEKQQNRFQLFFLRFERKRAAATMKFSFPFSRFSAEAGPLSGNVSVLFGTKIRKAVESRVKFLLQQHRGTCFFYSDASATLRWKTPQSRRKFASEKLS